MRSRRRTFAGLAAVVSAVLAIACIAVVVRKSGQTSLMQVGPIRVDNIALHHMEAPFVNLAKKGENIFQAKNFLLQSAPAAHEAKKQALKHVAPPAKHTRSAATVATPVKGSDHGIVYYYMPPAEKGAKLAQSKLQHIASHVMLAAPPPGVIVAPAVGDGPQVSAGINPCVQFWLR